MLGQGDQPTCRKQANEWQQCSHEFQDDDAAAGHIMTARAPAQQPSSNTTLEKMSLAGNSVYSFWHRGVATAVRTNLFECLVAGSICAQRLAHDLRCSTLRWPVLVAITQQTCHQRPWTPCGLQPLVTRVHRHVQVPAEGDTSGAETARKKGMRALQSGENGCYRFGWFRRPSNSSGAA